MYDSRAIANLILDCAEERGIACSNLKLQKLLYFVHGQWLLRNGKPLCSGTFEAWEHGPVHPLAYQAFKSFGANNITRKACSLNPVTREQKEISVPTSIEVLDVVRLVVGSLGNLSGSQLRNITHTKGSPWSIVVEASCESANIGMQISNDVIRENFGKQLYLLGGGVEEGDLNENAPYT